MHGSALCVVWLDFASLGSTTLLTYTTCDDWKGWLAKNAKINANFSTVAAAESYRYIGYKQTFVRKVCS